VATTTPFWSAHTHSKFSALDALPSVKDIVTRASELQYPALGLTDHGNIAGSVQLYTHARKAGIKPLPGIEAYMTFDRGSDPRPRTWHLGILATNAVGYTNLVGLSTLAHKNYKYKPLIDFGDMAQLAEAGLLDGLAVMTGCWFGLMPTLLREHDWRSSVNVVKALDCWFGSGCFVEIQNHQVFEGVQNDDATGDFLASIAMKAGIPVVITQDSHYCHESDREHHDNMKRLVSWSEDTEDAVFPGDGYHMVDTDWMRDHHPEAIFNAGMEGLAHLADIADVQIPELDTFQLKVPDTTSSGDPDTELTKRVAGRLFALMDAGHIPAKKAKEYSDRVDEELDVVIGAGFSGYLLFTAHVTDWMRRNNIEFGIRGSASGSILCWLLDISTLDPIAWGLSFERFLTRDRAKPPDIDIDMEHGRRQEVLDWLLGSFLTFNISTWAEMKASDDTGTRKGALVVKWRSAQRKKGLEADGPIPDEEWAKLQGIAQFEPYSGYGVHAAGLMIAPDEAALGQIPIQYVASSKTFVTGYDKDDVEAMGMVKLDLLGIKTLTAIRHMIEWTGVNTEQIPLNDRATYQAMRKGNVVGAFQLDGGSSIRGIRQLKPTRIQDVIAAMALFRPATMNSGATEDFIARRNKEADVPTRHAIIMEETKETYGVILYQDQALNIMKRLGLTVEEIEKARKAIKASNADVGGAQTVMDDLIGKIKERATDLSVEDLDFIEDTLSAYAGYGFNKAHATSYGLLAYITTWFSVHHPVEFWTAMLDAYAGEPQEAEYLKAARDAGITIRSPHINKSAVSFTADVPNKAIRKGLLSISGIGQKAAAEIAAHAPYTELSQFAERVNARVVTGAKALRSGHSPAACGGVVAILASTGALEGIPA
jgi:DNA polymerase III subunit alpha